MSGNIFWGLSQAFHRAVCGKTPAFGLFLGYHRGGFSRETSKKVIPKRPKLGRPTKKHPQKTNPKQKLDDGWPESEKGKDVDVKYIEERRRCEKISEERMNI